MGTARRGVGTTVGADEKQERFLSTARRLRPSSMSSEPADGAPLPIGGRFWDVAGGCQANGTGRDGSGLVQEPTVVGVEDPPAEDSQDVVPDRRRQVSRVVAAVGLGADPVGPGSAPGLECGDGVGNR
jgi:hypothetical protein